MRDILRENAIADTDGYKTSHYLQYPPGMTRMYSYMESRGGLFDRTVFFGLQYLIKRYLQAPVTTEDIDEMDAFCASYGTAFPRKGMERIRDLGYFPIRIRAVREGEVVPVHNAMMVIESTDPETFWIVGWLETMLMRLWYPITVATYSWHCKKVILKHLMKSGENPLVEIDWKLHDFGGRGVSSRESAGIGGMSHLANFKGSDTIEGIRVANHYYGTPEGQAAGSINAAEHSTITSWGRDHEVDAYRNMVKKFAKPGSLVAVVSDSYNVFDAVAKLWCGSLLKEVQESGGTVVVRPDSGDPATVVLKLMQIFDERLDPLHLMTINSKGYKVLPSFFRIIQGDGVNIDSIDEILTTLETHGYSASNVAFGMGGALLQKVDRDTQKFAIKCSAAFFEKITEMSAEAGEFKRLGYADGEWKDVFKDPVTDSGKVSKKGRLELTRTADGYKTIPESELDGESALVLVFENGKMMGNSVMLDVVRANALEALRAAVAR